MVIIESILSHDYINGPSDKTDFLAANQSSIQFIEVSVRFETFVFARSITATDTSRPFIATNPTNGLIPRTPNAGFILTNHPDGWLDFNVGDEITIIQPSISNIVETITEILDNGTLLRTTGTFGSAFLAVNSYVAVTTDIQSISYKHALIENFEPVNYLSKVDGSEQIAQLGGLLSTNTSDQTAVMLGNKSWQFGSIQIKGNNAGLGDHTGSQGFVITHEILINPLTRFDEWDDTQAGIKPDRLIDSNSLKYVFSAGLSVEENNPNDEAIIEEDELLGNVGWFNENLNGIPTNYSFTTPIYKRADTTVIESIELTTAQQTVEYFIDNTETSPFLDGSTKVIVGHNFAPSDKSQYRDIVAATSQTMEYNFIFDQVVETLGSGGVAVPRQFGTNLQVIKKVDATIVNATRIKVVVTIEMHTDVVSRISANGIRRFMLYSETANHTLGRSTTDKVQLLIDANDYFTDVTDDGMIVMEQSILTHPFSDIVTETEEFVNLFKEADFVGVNNFYIDKATREADEIILTGITNEVIAKKTTGASFILDAKSRNLSAFPQVNYSTDGSISNVNFSEDRGFKTPVDDVRANMKLNRIYASDSAQKYYFRSSLPTRIGWNDYTALSNVNNEFFDSTEPNDGENNDWIRYDLATNWSIVYRTTVNALKNGNPLTYQEDTTVSTFDYLAGDEWDTEQIKSFDENDVELTGFGITYADGKLQANFTFIGATTPSLSDLVIDFHLYVYQEGTFKSIYTMSSAYDAHVNTLFKSIDTSNRTVVTDEGAGVFRGEVLTDGIKIAALNKSTFQVSALIYDKRGPSPPVPPAVGILEEDGVTFILEEGSSIFGIEE